MEGEQKKRGRKPKPKELKKRPHQVYATDTQWAEIERRATEANKEASVYVIDKALE